MAILLKEQLQRLSEGVHYVAPSINVLKKGREDEATRKKAVRMFYDFYAMELMHRLLGSPKGDPDYGKPEYANKLTPQQLSKYKAVSGQYGMVHAIGMSNFDWNDIEDIPANVKHVPHQLRRVIDQVYEEVVKAVSDKMMAHLRMGLIQEFRYIVTHANDWQSFRQRLVSIYNKNNGKITKAEFDQAVAEKIPGFKGHEDAVKRLLKFSKYYSAMTPDPADHLPSDSAPKVGKPVGGEPETPKDQKPEVPNEPSEPWPEEKPQPMPGDFPDDTDYNAPSIDIPAGADWDQDDSWKTSPEMEKEKIKQWLKNKKGIDESIHDHGYAAGRMSPHTILAVRQAINKSGLTWNDILLAYTELNWGGAYGGPKWGAGVEALIHLLPHAKDLNYEDMAGVLDHIYDLDHNTGQLLNKGGMYVPEHDLDRRAKITSLTRFLPNVSPLIQRLILRVLPYVSKHPEIDKDINKVISSPIQAVPPEVAEKLPTYKFAKSVGSEWTTQAPYETKKVVNGQRKVVQNSYTLKYHTNGLYSVQDTMDSDVQVFETWPELEEWLNRNKNDFIMPQPGIGHYNVPKQETQKEKILNSHQNIKLDAAKETQLLDICKMAWRPSAHYYKAYLPANDRFQFFAFSDGSFMGCKKSNPNNVFHVNDWNQAFSLCKTWTANALPNKDYDEGKAWIGKDINAPEPTVTPSTQPSVGAPPQAQMPYALSQIEVNVLQILASQHGGVTFEPHVAPEGNTAISVPVGGTKFNVLIVGKKAVAPTGKKYIVTHAVKGGPLETWDFANWTQTYNFITHNWDALTQADNPVKGTVSVAFTPSIFSAPAAQTPLPPNATSKAIYKAHVGLDKPPTHTIRLTKEDEDALANVGFEPKMVGSDVWYIHKTANDSVKFFPNDEAKIMFIKTNNKVIVTKKVEEAIEWLKAKYSAAGSSPMAQQQATSGGNGSKGSKAGAMYEKIISDAGFNWDANTGKYIQSDNGDTIEIRPFPKSTFTHKQSGETKKFGSLPELAAYVKNYANGVKKK